MKNFTREEIRKILRPNVDSFIRLGAITEEEISNKSTELEAKTDSEKRSIRLENDPISELISMFETLESRVQNLSDGRASSPYVFYTLNQNLTVYSNSATVVSFSNLVNGSQNALQNLGLSLARGAFTSNKANNLLLVSYQLMFDQNSSQTGSRQSYISIGQSTYARQQTPTIQGRSVIISGSAPILLGRDESFSIRAFHTDNDNIDLLSSNTRLSIVGL